MEELFVSAYRSCCGGGGVAMHLNSVMTTTRLGLTVIVKVSLFKLLYVLSVCVKVFTKEQSCFKIDLTNKHWTTIINLYYSRTTASSLWSSVRSMSSDSISKSLSPFITLNAMPLFVTVLCWIWIKMHANNILHHTWILYCLLGSGFAWGNRLSGRPGIAVRDN